MKTRFRRKKQENGDGTSGKSKEKTVFSISGGENDSFFRFSRGASYFILVAAAVAISVSVALITLPHIVYSVEYSFLEIKSDSMFPTLKPGDLVVIKKAGVEDVEEGDIIAFDSHVDGIGIIAHRAVEKAEDRDGNVGIDTKGDHQEHADPWTVYNDNMIGKVEKVNPSLGILLEDYARYSLVVIAVASSAIFGRELVLLSRKKKRKDAIEVQQLTCKRCGYSWYPRVISGKVKIPDTCPNKECRSPYWDKPRQR